MKRSPIGPRKTRLERKRLLRARRPWRAAGAAGGHQAREQFNDVGAFACALWYRGGCDGPLDAHHVVPKRAIKSYAKTHRLDARSLSSLLWDTHNRLVLCRRHHDLHETAKQRIPFADVPQTAHGFAIALKLDHLIDRFYPDD